LSIAKGSQPVSPEVREQFLEPFISATTLAMSEWARTDVAVLDVFQQTFTQSFGDLAALLRFKSENEEFIILGVTYPTASGLAKRVFDGVLDVVDPAMIDDCIGEMGNVISGQAKALLAGTPYQFSFSTPLVARSDGPELSGMKGRDCLVIMFACDLGEFAVQLVMKR
jgi:CheY-specific phosphatase CheX